jgi:hypothetical protein
MPPLHFCTQTGKKIGGSVVVEDADERATLEAELPVRLLVFVSDNCAYLTFTSLQCFLTLDS